MLHTKRSLSKTTNNHPSFTGKAEKGYRTERKDITMDSKKMITLYGYKVVYYDLREKKPRQAHETIKVYDGECLRACEVLKGGVHNYIEENFTSKGYFVKAIEKQKARRVLVDYGTLYAAAPTIEELESNRG